VNPPFGRQVFRFKKAIPRAIISRVPKWMFHVQNNVILDDDVIFLHRQQVSHMWSVGVTNIVTGV
jgi:hypothetical protein